ncbi:MAG: ribonuclease P protein component [Candidatus Ryanbacteria bacterium RIFCSPHIGHO2_02_FULL_45_13b]|uniref:Ribonuclease P protein component n=1 Tax=Candidatus Ryanbacteria bacterium RIFCSPHIGHO2_02_FULL_45_13b TaxID=1802117 RepID=A0A1G2G4H7_9BACT|nr:MAG: ribonuclease P protein component [Candidatus Ryanbacteria bacterium RIFCSPHIGHO2_02_FULL_45_13b]
MLRKENRLRAENDFKKVFHGGARARSGPFQLLCRKSAVSNARFGFVIPLSVSKKAVQRNKLRRQLREIVRTVFYQKVSGYDCVIRVYAGADRLKYQDIEKHIISVFHKIQLL